MLGPPGRSGRIDDEAWGVAVTRREGLGPACHGLASAAWRREGRSGRIGDAQFLYLNEPVGRYQQQHHTAGRPPERKPPRVAPTGR